MLQRAASNAYSWWWASHIRTKQSKWLEQNLLDMEDRVNNMLKIIDLDGDSFAKRAEMYYKKRPELMEFVEESFRAYRSLAERYDHLSRELQSANRTIAAVYPEQVQFALDDYDDDDTDESGLSKKLALSPDPTKSSPPQPPSHLNIPKTPDKALKLPPRFVVPKKEQFKRTTSFTRTIMGSGLSKDEALEEIDDVQKEVLILQTEREFMKSSYENGLAKFLELENRISEMQERVYSLQDEFGIGTIIEDDEARKLMASTALKSCQQTIEHLREEQEKCAQEAEEESRRIDEARDRLEIIKDKHFNKSQPTRQNSSPDAMHSSPDDEREARDLEVLQQKIKDLQVGHDSKSLTMSELAARIDDIVETVISLETALSSQAALVLRLRMETSELLAHIRNLEENKEGWSESSEELRNRIKELEDELRRVNNLSHKVEHHNNNLETHLREASSDIIHLSGKLSNVKTGEEGDEEEEVSVGPDILDVHSGIEMEEETETYNSKDEVESVDYNIPQVSNQQQARVSSSQGSGSEFENTGGHDEVEMVNGLNDKEKFLLREYASVLKSLKEVKEQLVEVEKKNQVGLFEQAVQIREIMHMKDEEIQALRHKFGTIHHNGGDAAGQQQPRSSNAETARSEMDLDGSPQYSEISSLSSDRKTVYDLLYGQNVEPVENTTEVIARRKMAFSLNGLRMLLRGDQQQDLAIINDKFRAVLDHLLEENMDFWLRFSAAIQQVHKFQSTTQDLKGEISKLREAKKQSAAQDTLKSDARPIYKHIKEIQTELKVWVEHNALLKVEIQSRYSTLCHIQEEVTQLAHMGGCRHDAGMIENQALKFQGEIINMKRETNKVAGELQSGLNRVKSLQIDTDIALLRMDEEFGIEHSKTKTKIEPPPPHSATNNNTKKSSRPRVPLRSFLFGVKLKKRKQKPPSIFSCVSHPSGKHLGDINIVRPLPPP
uniref:NAB domain-containing protein n=1 Tax=Kalanchoe fedtschenkoi TaxID=63787 RepID=A0A7N0TU76_KALFE